MSKRALTTLSAVFLFWAMVPGPASAQEQTFHACYVPEVGAMYLIGLSGLPTECLSSEHVEISWTEGGATVTDHGELTGLSDDDHPEYVREGEPAGGDLAGTFPDPSVTALRGNALASTAPSDGQVLIWSAGTTTWEPQALPSGVTDHGNLSGLTDDDHPQYLLIDGTRALTGNLSVADHRITDLGAATDPGDAVPFEQAVKSGDAAAGDLGGTFPDPSVTALQGNLVATTAPSGGQVLTWNGTNAEWEPQTPSSGVTDHGDLSGLADDDHPEYVRDGEAAGGDLGGTFPRPSVIALRGNLLSTTAPATEQVLAWDATNTEWQPVDQKTLTQTEVSTYVDDWHTSNGQVFVGEGEAAGGDLGGTYPSPSVTALQGNLVATTAPSGGQVLTWNGTTGEWEPQTSPSGVTDHGNLSGLADDDHTQYVLGDGVRSTTNGFAVTGTYNSGSIPVEGAGVRVMWYPGKAAFRAGRVSGTEWDDANVGIQSIALGTNVTASGIWTTAIGVGATAYAPNGGAMALGGNTTASADGALAMGLGTEASGEGSTAMGVNTVASMASATAMGEGTTASGEFSTAMGGTTSASGYAATAMGHNTTASANFTTAMGRGAVATGGIATAMGLGTEAQALASLVIGRSNVVEGSTDSWVSTDPLFVAGNGTSSRSNALTLYKNGSMTIAGSLTERSDARLKTGIMPLGSVLEDIGSIRAVRFRFREGTGHPADPQIGLIAQEVAGAFPELVTTNSEGYLSLAYPKLTAVLVRAIQEQQDQIEAQRERLEALTARLERLEAALERREPDEPQ